VADKGEIGDGLTGIWVLPIASIAWLKRENEPFR
jgi:hypothetical protein